MLKRRLNLAIHALSITHTLGGRITSASGCGCHIYTLHVAGWTTKRIQLSPCRTGDNKTVQPLSCKPHPHMWFISCRGLYVNLCPAIVGADCCWHDTYAFLDWRHTSYTSSATMPITSHNLGLCILVKIWRDDALVIIPSPTHLFWLTVALLCNMETNWHKQNGCDLIPFRCIQNTSFHDSRRVRYCKHVTNSD